jgi:SAM-dependent methyltransferase
MFDLYQDIFSRRGAAYHAAMALAPLARKEEFDLVLAGSSLEAGHTICDMPAGGGYLQNFLDVAGVEIIAVENTEAFYEECRRNPGVQARLCPLDSTGLGEGTVDHVVSLAGLHHAESRASVFAEMQRILRPGGTLCIADVMEGSSVARFLDECVDSYNSMGHSGDFLRDTWLTELNAAGFIDVNRRDESFGWNFRDEEEMVSFCRLLFGMDRASDEEIRQGIDSYVGYTRTAQGIRMNWKLAYVRATRAFTGEN